MKDFLFKAYDFCGNAYDFDTSKTDRGILLTLKKEKISGMNNICALGEFTQAQMGDEGFYLIPRSPSQASDILVRFEKRNNIVFNQENPIMAILGIKKNDACYLIRIERNYRFHINIEAKNSKYNLSVVFELERDCPATDTNGPQEDIRIEIFFLDACDDWYDIARLEREIRLERNEITTLKEKCKTDAVEYARKYPLIRIRCAWKPSPTPVLHQTTENEPAMHIACDFKRVRELADECKAQGVEGAEFQLVGWNIKGHDGRWPQAFPVEEELGGESELINTIAHLKKLGYRISLHDNVLDAYEIADNFSFDDLTKTKDGTYESWGDWSGGCSYNICPTAQKRNAEQRVPRMMALGVNGMHYSDVISLANPSACFDKNHPLHYKSSLDITKEIMGYMKKSFGAFSSEGAMDFSLGYIDYALYTSLGAAFGNQMPDICSEAVNAYEVAYHGIVLYNPICTTVNYPIKHPQDRLTLIMRGGKPSFYFYSKFCTGTKVNWMGEDDFTCTNDEDMKKSVALIKKSLNDYKKLCHLQLEFMDKYEVTDDGVEIASYACGTTKKHEGKEIEPYGFIMID